MHLTTRNVNTAFRELVKFFQEDPASSGYISGRGKPYVVRRPSRNGPVLMIDEPVTITYTHPRERVLFNAARDANPFFHLYHSLWMLAGRNDVASLSYYVGRMKDFSDDGKTLNGAYGYRWRHYDSASLPRRVDQLEVIIDHLKADPISRRAVLQMWNVEDDLLKIGPGEGTSRDVCCNTSVYFSMREREEIKTVGPRYGSVDLLLNWALDVTITNRSNDLIWGCLGEDFTTFSILQEYMAARIGCEVGRYHQFSNNLHVYESNWKPNEWLNEHEVLHDRYCDIENGKQISPFSLVKDPATFERELPRFVEEHGGERWRTDVDACVVKSSAYQEPFLRDVASPMLSAFRADKLSRQFPGSQNGYQAYVSICLGAIKADDWRIAATGWIDRRRERRERRNSPAI